MTANSIVGKSCGTAITIRLLHRPYTRISCSHAALDVGSFCRVVKIPEPRCIEKQITVTVLASVTQHNVGQPSHETPSLAHRWTCATDESTIVRRAQRKEY